MLAGVSFHGIGIRVGAFGHLPSRTCVWAKHTHQACSCSFRNLHDLQDCQDKIHVRLQVWNFVSVVKYGDFLTLTHIFRAMCVCACPDAWQLESQRHLALKECERNLQAKLLHTHKKLQARRRCGWLPHLSARSQEPKEFNHHDRQRALT